MPNPTAEPQAEPTPAPGPYPTEPLPQAAVDALARLDRALRPAVTG